MKKAVIIIIALLVVQMCCLSLWAANQTIAKPFTISTKSSNSMEIRFNVPEFDIEKEIASGKVWDKITVEGTASLTEEGLPQLPVMTTSVAIPNHGSVEVELINAHTKMIKHILPYPSQDDSSEDSPRLISSNQAFYNGTDKYPLEVIKYSDPQILRDFRIITIQIQPFSWNAATGELEVNEQVDFRLNFTEKPGMNELDEPLAISPCWDNLYESIILNYRDFSRNVLMSSTPPKYLIIHGNYTDTNFLAKVNEFALWKKQKGANVRLVSTAVTGTTTTDIKNYIQSIYNDINSRPDFIILIGDTSGSFSIPTYHESWSGLSGHGDYPYQHLSGTDYLGDVFLGRISAENTSQLDVILSKVYTYEKNINVGTAQWLNKMLLVGDTNPSGMGLKYAMRNIKELSLNYNPDYTFTELYGDPSASAMDAAMNQGVGFFWYRGWIGMSGWNPGSSLVNGVKLPHTIIITCGTGYFADGTSTSEAFIRLGTAAVPSGAVTSIGMDTSHTNPMCNNALVRGIGSGIFNYNMRTMGEALLNGKLVASSWYGQTHASVVNYSNHWANLMGDPTMEVYCKIPDTFITNAPTTFPLGTSYLDMIVTDQNSVPVKDACVTICQDNLILARGYTDEAGYVYLFFNTALIANPAIITVSKHEFKPLQSTIAIDTNGSLVAGVSIIDDDNVGNSSGNGDFSANSGETLEILFAVRNTTSQMIDNVTGFATCSSQYATIVNDGMNFTSIDTNASNYSITPVLVQIAPTCPHNTIIRFELHLTDANDSTYVIPSFIYVTDAYMNVLSFQVIDTNNQALDPSETVDLTLTIKNNGAIAVNDLYGQLITLNDLVRIDDNTGYFGNLMAGAQITSSTDMFTVYGRPMILRGMPIPMRLRLYNAAGFQQWVDFTFTAGTATSTDPLGPDDYGYVIYDVTDTAYEDCPTYEWVGIAPAEGGQGTLLSFTDSSVDVDGDNVDVVSCIGVDLPFPFRFYGTSYSHITVCSNGFIAMGSTENGNWANCMIPGQGGPSPLIAPFWDDLITGQGGCYKWYDSVNHRYIIEWYNFKNGYNQSSIECFQVMLYDQAYTPTTTGDGPIKIQYNTFNNVDYQPGDQTVAGHGNYATIGIQNLLQTTGLQYSFNNQYPPAAAPLSNQKALYITTAPIYYFSPNLVYESSYVVDNNNNVIEPNEVVDLYVNLNNTGEEVAQGISASLACSSPYVTMINSVSTYAPINGETTGDNDTPFRFSVAADCPDNQVLPFVISITTDSNFWTRSFNLFVEKPSVAYHSYFMDDHQGNTNGVPDPGESIKLAVQVTNNSLVDAHNLSGMLTSTLMGVTVNNPVVEKPVLSPGEIIQLVYDVTLAATIPSGSNLPFNFILNSSDAPSVTQAMSIACGTGGTVLDFESSDGGFVSMSGWVYGDPEIVNPHSGNKLWATNLTGQYENNAMYILKTPQIVLGNNAMLTFWHYLSCQNYWDGGNVSISTDGGTSFTLITPTGGYNTTLNINALGEIGYTNTVNWSQAAFDLTAYAGQPVVIRWRFGSNSAGQGTGWFIDDVMVSGYFIAPGMVAGNVELLSDNDVSLVKLTTNTRIVSNPNTEGAYAVYLPQGTYTLVASLPYHISQTSPSFDLNELNTTYNYDFSLDYLAGPSMLEYSGAIGDSILYLTWIAPPEGTYPIEGYKVYRKFADYPYQMIIQTTEPNYSEELETTGTYSYYVKPVYSIGDGAPSNTVLVAFPFVSNPEGPTPVYVNSLNPNYPNPFNPETVIAFSTAKAGPVKLRIYNTKGQLVRTLASDTRGAGLHRIVWDGRNNNRNPVSSGMYLYKLDVPGYSRTRKMMLLK
jgi:hypothetical protein